MTALRRGIAIVLVIALAGPLVETRPAGAVTTSSKTIQGSATNTQQREWFNKTFDTGQRFFGKLQGRIRFVADTTVTLTTTRTINSTDLGDVDAGQQVVTELHNVANAARLQMTARPALQLIFEWQPQGDSYVCDNTTFPTFSDDEWFMRRDGGGPIADGVCGAIEVAADDLNWILQNFGIDLELPEVFLVLDKFFAAAFGGTQNLTESHQLVEIKVCKILTDTFGLPIGDHCDLELNAVVTAPLTTLGHTLEAQLCIEGQLDGSPVPCLLDVGPQQTLTYTSELQSFSTQAPCPGAATDTDVRITNPAWNAQLDDPTMGPTLDFIVHLTANGDGVDIMTIPLPGSIPLLNEPMPLDVTYPAGDQFTLHVAEVTPDDDPPSVLLNPSDVTIDEGSSTTFTPVAVDGCTATADLSSTWTIDGTTIVSPTLTSGYSNDLPTAVHNGSLTVSDGAGNAAAPVPISVTVRNVAPTVQLSLPTTPAVVGTSVPFSAAVTDPGSDLMTWQWSFGDGATASRTAASPLDRTDSRGHIYTQPGEYIVEVAVGDGTDTRTVTGGLVVFDPTDRLVGYAKYVADSTSIGVPVGSKYTVAANVGYPKGALHPSGQLTGTFLMAAGGSAPQPAKLAATSFEWVFDDGSVTRAQGFGTINGAPGWKFRVEVTRISPKPASSRVIVTIWRPGFTTADSPDVRFSGPWHSGNIL